MLKDQSINAAEQEREQTLSFSTPRSSKWFLISRGRFA
jgi:hypothetical protein